MSQICRPHRSAHAGTRCGCGWNWAFARSRAWAGTGSARAAPTRAGRVGTFLLSPLPACLPLVTAPGPRMAGRLAPAWPANHVPSAPFNVACLGWAMALRMAGPGAACGSSQSPGRNRRKTLSSHATPQNPHDPIPTPVSRARGTDPRAECSCPDESRMLCSMKCCTASGMTPRGRAPQSHLSLSDRTRMPRQSRRVAGSRRSIRRKATAIRNVMAM